MSDLSIPHGPGSSDEPKAGGTPRVLTRLAIGAALLASGVALLTLPRARHDPDRLCRRAEAEFEANRLDRAEAILDQLGGDGRPSTSARFLRARIAAARGQTDAALYMLTGFPDSDPSAARALAMAGCLELGRDLARLAEERWVHALRLDPDLIEARESLACLYAVQLRKADFDAQFRALAEHRRVGFADVLSWSRVRCEIYDPGWVTARLEKFVAADPGDRASRLALIEVALRAARHDEAERLLAALPVEDDDARSTRGRLALDRGDAHAAAAILEGGSDTHPALARARGRLALARGAGPVAVRCFRRALEAGADFELLQEFGSALQLTGREDEAREILERARRDGRVRDLVRIASEENHRPEPALIRDLAAACEVAGRVDEANAWSALLTARDPPGAEAGHVRPDCLPTVAHPGTAQPDS